GRSGQMREVNRVLTVGEGIIGRVAASGTTAVMRDVMGSPDLLPSAHEAVRRARSRGFVCVPIHARGRMLGTLSLGRQTDDPFDEGEVTLLEATAQQIAIALDNARLSSELVHAEKLSAVGALASGVAHEINNPLTTVLGLAQLMLGRPDVPLPVRGRIARIAGEASRGGAVLSPVLMFARHGPRHATAAAVAHLRSILHDQATGRRHWPRSVGLVWHRRPARRAVVRGESPGGRRDVRRRAAGGGAGLSAPRASRRALLGAT